MGWPFLSARIVRDRVGAGIALSWRWSEVMGIINRSDPFRAEIGGLDWTSWMTRSWAMTLEGSLGNPRMVPWNLVG